MYAQQVRFYGLFSKTWPTLCRLHFLRFIFFSSTSFAKKWWYRLDFLILISSRIRIVFSIQVNSYSRYRWRVIKGLIKWIKVKCCWFRGNIQMFDENLIKRIFLCCHGKAISICHEHGVCKNSYSYSCHQWLVWKLIYLVLGGKKFCQHGSP